MARSPRAARAGTGLRHVLVRDLVLQASIGVYQHEQVSRQRVRINLDLGVREGDLATIDDRLAGVRHYEWVIESVRAVVADGHLNLVETLAERIAAACFEDARVREVRVRVEKLDIFPDAASVGIEIERKSPYP